MSIAYEIEVDLSDKLHGIGLVADSLNRGEVAAAQIAALLLRLPVPSVVKSKAPDRLSKAMWLFESGLLGKDWIEADHPRAGTPPNPGWFATQSGGSDTRSVTSNGTEGGRQSERSSSLSTPG